MNEVIFTLVGASYRPAASQLLVVSLSPADHVYLEPEPSNKFDKNAVKVLTTMGVHIGYVNKDSCLDVLEFLQNNPNYLCRVRAKVGSMSAVCELTSDVLDPDA
jgi:HIRAN domain